MYVSELRTRKYRGKSLPVMADPNSVARLVGPRIRNELREHFLALLLNNRHELLRLETISVGSLSASIVHPREVFRLAVIEAAAGLIVVHNHPSGDPEPSPEDVAVTRRLAEAGTILGIEILDHVIVAKRGFTSLKARDVI